MESKPQVIEIAAPGSNRTTDDGGRDRVSPITAPSQYSHKNLAPRHFFDTDGCTPRHALEVLKRCDQKSMGTGRCRGSSGTAHSGVKLLVFWSRKNLKTFIVPRCLRSAKSDCLAPSSPPDTRTAAHGRGSPKKTVTRIPTVYRFRRCYDRLLLHPLRGGGTGKTGAKEAPHAGHKRLLGTLPFARRSIADVTRG